MLIDKLTQAVTPKNRAAAKIVHLHPTTPGETFTPQSTAAADLDRQQWRLLVRNTRNGNTQNVDGEGFNEKEKSKLTPQKLAEMSRGQLGKVNRNTLTDLHLEMGRDLFNETNLADDRHYGSKNAQRTAYTEALGRIVRIHGDSPVGEEAAAMLADCLSKVARVETRETKRTGPSQVAKNEKYGFAGGSALFHHLVRKPGSVAGSEEILQALHDTKLNTVSPKHKPRPDRPDGRPPQQIA